MAKPVEQMTASEIQKAHDRAYAKQMAACRAIPHEFGHIRMADLRNVDHPAVRAYFVASDAYMPIADEMDARKRWHGSLKPIRRSPLW